MCNDIITIMEQDVVVEEKCADEYPDSIRYYQQPIIEDKNEWTFKKVYIPVRVIKKYYIGKNEELVAKEKATAMRLELYDKSGKLIRRVYLQPDSK